jgi:hypothetical protein
VDKVNRGPCRGCGRPILYMGALFCGPGCHFAYLSSPPTAVDVLPPEPVAIPEPVPQEPEPVVTPEPEPYVPRQSGFMSLEPPPDEAPKRRRIYL